MGKIIRAGMVLTAALALAACGSVKTAGNSIATSASPTVATVPTATDSPQATVSAATAPATTAPPAPATTGSTIAVSDGAGHTAKVTLTKITDPAQGADQFTTPDPGKRFVAATVTIANTTAGSALTGDANSNMTLIGSDDQDYTPDFSNVVGCTNFNDGEYTIAPGQSLAGCVTFQLPTSVTPAKAQFALGDFGGTDGQWTIGSAA